MIPPAVRRWFRLDTGRTDVRAEVDDELRFHLESTIAELMAEGMAEAAAREEAERRCGSLTRAREDLVRIDAGREQRVRSLERLGTVWHDLRLAARSLAREPWFALTVAATLALGIGVNTTMVGLVDRLLFRPPAHVQGADRLAQLSLTETHPVYGASTNTGLAWPDYVLASGLPAFSGTAAFYTSRLTAGQGAAAERVRVTMATAGFFPLLGVEPVIGRFYDATEDAVRGGAAVTVLSDRFWRRRFGADPAAIGTTLQLGSGRFTIIGVAPRGFTGIELSAVDAWVPVGTGAPEMLGPSTEWASTRDWQWVRVIGRLAPGVGFEEAGTALTTAYRREIAAAPGLSPDASFAFDLHGVHPGAGPEAPRSTRITGWLAAVSFAVLLIACANVANLLLARGTRRRRELAVRLALGVGRRRLVAQLLMEAGMLAALGGLLALAVVQWGSIAIRRFLLPDIDWVGAPVDGRAALITAAAALLTVFVAGLLPALRSSRADLAEALKAGGGAGRDRGGARLRRSLLVTQTALSVILLMGAGLFVRSLRSVVRLDLGFEPTGLLVADLDWAERGVARERRLRLGDRLEAAVRRLPGLVSVSQGTAVPFQTRNSVRLRLPGRDSVPRLPTGTPSYNGVGPDFLATTGMRLVRGRAFTDRDRAGAPPVAIVNETMARTFWPAGDAIGECLLIGPDPLPPCATVVGVVADARREELVEDPTMQYLVPIAQTSGLGLAGWPVLFLRTAGPADAMVDPVRLAILSDAPELAWASVTPMERFLEPHVQPWRLGAGVFAIFGLLALLVAAVGLYGSLAYSVAVRGREFGVRGALGASSPDLVRQIVGEGVRLTGIGLIIGVAGSLVGGRFAAALLFETSPSDPRVLAGVAVVLLATATAASLVPAFRAARVPPADSLRAE